jgi:dolichyl-phosphate-mannose-protein mannosyltransferase
VAAVGADAPRGPPSHILAAYDRGVTMASTAQTASAPSPDVARHRPQTGLPDVVRRRLAPLDARLDPRSWLATAVVVLIAAVLRFVDLGSPKGKIFDETYYAKDAYGLLERGVEWNYKENTASFVVHPPLGKWLIAIGEWAFGYQDVESRVSVPGHLVTLSPEFGWRFAAAVFGTLSVLLVVRIGRRLFRSTALGCAAGLLMALDGFHLVLSRTALLDIFLLFFVLAAFGALLLDRDARRRWWLRALEAGFDPSRPGLDCPPLTLRAGVPWWRFVAAALLGCAIAVKWSALAFVPAFVLLVLFWEAGLRRSAGARWPWMDALLYEIGWLSLCGVVIVLVYLATWSGWLLTDSGYDRHYRAGAGLSEPPVIGALLNLYEYHRAAFNFHNTLVSKHTYQSWPWQWLLLGRPVAFHWSNQGSCGTSSCASEVLLLGTPLLWWSFLPAIGGLAWLGAARRDWRAAAILLMLATALLPWFYFALDRRTMFSFYTAPAEPFLVLAVVYVLGALMSPVRSPQLWLGIDRRTLGAVIAGGYLVLVALCFAYFHPIFVGQQIPYPDWSARMWLGGRWI